ncbi:Aste57867_22035 [Aphanomyces stellatus]|uniref:Aste57867_22035 protein n=1 Tax=Aphanomyces stellatus TaxID=120398 RepID=A0A485LL66_9STRA|nr:hypothetical protein As57867_021966 [Aphanomyces stellatus]VFT98703.1 Aste57867_22035 [Aphanomyces stellatus]
MSMRMSSSSPPPSAHIHIYEELNDKPSVFLGLAKIVIMLVNVAFMILAGLLVYFATWVRNAGLVAIFTNYAWVSNATFAIVLSFGILVVTVSFVGCLGAWAKQRHLLLVFAVGQTINLLFFILLSTAGFLSLHLVNSWQIDSIPTTPETSLAQDFNPFYCQSQVAYFCSVGSVGDSLALFLGPDIAAKAGHAFDRLYGWYQVCDGSTISVTDPDLAAKVNATCVLCHQYPIATYGDFLTSVANACPLTPAMTPWCAGYFNSSNRSMAMLETTPYGNCRSSFLGLWQSLSKWVAYGALGTALLSYVCNDIHDC